MTELVLVSAPDEAGLVTEAKRLAAFLDRTPSASLADVAYTCSLSHGASTLAIVAADTASLRSRLVSAANRLAGGATRLRDRSGTYYFREPLLGEGGAALPSSTRA